MDIPNLEAKELTVHSFERKVSSATKWSVVTEVSITLVQPIVSIILARLLLPQAFGIIANITMITSFASMFADAGFSKYIIQHEFRTNDELEENACVAFWTNFAISLLLLAILILFRKPFALFLGNEGYEKPLVVSCFSLPLIALTSIQTAIYKRKFQFKALFWARLIAACIPFAVTVPLALQGFGYWALLFGTLSSSAMHVLVLTFLSDWKPRFFYSLTILKQMFSFSYWSLIESISIWLTSWIDVFLIHTFLSPYYIGLYKNSISLVNSITVIVTASFTSVLFPALSRCQQNEAQFNATYQRTQKIVAYLLIPLGMGIFIFRDFITVFLLGENWVEAAPLIGAWALSSGFVVVFSAFASEVYRSKGKPKISVLHQILWLSIIIPLVMISLKNGFQSFVIWRIVARITGIPIAFLLLRFFFGISHLATIQNTIRPLAASLLMSLFALVLRNFSTSNLWYIASILICIVEYFLSVRFFCKADYFEIVASLRNREREGNQKGKEGKTRV
ncbi:membrane protein involved in the export of O-antigen and teichoic acid [Sphaerochaeta pleomorpha str. Grapes]|uniref:Membrane protein involved in the export of O-antigen and teichoic acid n=1 Tax=Sphaerochaeta pleomorpha (strain ATCC BAA-1885 / DSM 22778 / Grapes) TaxID=158190 RepID=G8QW82_SPHPG|nr:lipopolysaccharide biosynthesis protein [Sphaerochaeta pleomorpha]AEV29380.1 membrane protein involved in the export of O-antigen and teichoic acid [Sphaerochaeta pleomorpha str. Grapes]